MKLPYKPAFGSDPDVTILRKKPKQTLKQFRKTDSKQDKKAGIKQTKTEKAGDLATFNAFHKKRG